MDPENENLEGQGQEQGQATAGQAAAATGEGAGKEPEGADKHGNPAISKGKYERDMKAANDRIAALEAQVEEAKKSEERAAELKSELEKAKGEFAAREMDYKLAAAGCTDANRRKAAKALIGDYGGDVDKLKADNPYLFDDAGGKSSGTTGGKPAGASGADIDEKLDRAFGLK